MKKYKLYLSYFVDSVCIESMSVTITRRTLDRCHENIDHLSNSIQR